MAYTNLAAVKLQLGTTSTGHDTLIGNYILAAQAWVDAHCKCSFEGTTTTRYYDYSAIDSMNRLRLDDDLLSTSTGSLTITNGDTGATVITSTQYRLEPYNSVSKRL